MKTSMGTHQTVFLCNYSWFSHNYS